MNILERINITGQQSLTTALTLCLLLLLPALSHSIQAEEKTVEFDHFSTGFPLTGRHEFIDCSECHIAGQFRGTPMECGLCHNGVRAPGKDLHHFKTSNFCDDCHTEYAWQGARFDHIDIQGACQSCHNNITAIGKSPSHIASSDICEDCHNTISFDSIGRVDHASVIGTCDSCHNGIIARGKPSDHPATTEQCNECHTTYSWDADDD